MDTSHYEILWAGSPLPDLFCQPDDLPVHLFISGSYFAAVQAIQENRVDILFVTETFDDHSGLELIHHARLWNRQIPIVLVCTEYSSSLDYKAHKIGATECISLQAVDDQFIRTMLPHLPKSPYQKGGQGKSPFKGFRESSTPTLHHISPAA